MSNNNNNNTFNNMDSHPHSPYWTFNSNKYYNNSNNNNNSNNSKKQLETWHPHNPPKETPHPELALLHPQRNRCTLIQHTPLESRPQSMRTYHPH
eukprot:12103421-Karenia_brevis.AAC.1